MFQAFHYHHHRHRFTFFLVPTAFTDTLGRRLSIPAHNPRQLTTLVPKPAIHILQSLRREGRILNSVSGRALNNRALDSMLLPYMIEFLVHFFVIGDSYFQFVFESNFFKLDFQSLLNLLFLKVLHE